MQPQIRLGTVDIFQGQEAKIVIVSLVRNTGAFETGSASIGFLNVRILRYPERIASYLFHRAPIVSMLPFRVPNMVYIF